MGFISPLNNRSSAFSRGKGSTPAPSCKWGWNYAPHHAEARLHSNEVRLQKQLAYDDDDHHSC